LTLFETRDITEASKITVVIKAGHTMAGVPIRRLETRAEVSVEEAMKVFWNSEEFISRTFKLDLASFY